MTLACNSKLDNIMHDRNIKFSIDRGGTFTDVFAQVIREFDHTALLHLRYHCSVLGDDH